jgi:hypothetical protein
VDRTALSFGVDLGWLGTENRAAEELVRSAERWGITSWCTHAPSGPALARVIAEVRS